MEQGGFPAWLRRIGARLRPGAGSGLAWGAPLWPSVLRQAAWNSKVLGSAFARRLYAEGLAGPQAPPQKLPVPIRLTSGLCRQRDIEAPWLRYWCGRLGMVPIYHRKVWEDCFVLQALWEGGMMTGRRRGLGFAVGREALPAFLAAQGATVLATDLPREDRRAAVWHATRQHAAAAEALFFPHLIERADFDERVAFRPVDMARIPEELCQGGFDFLWSVCSLEHLGSLEAGLDFVRRAMRCLRPGGLAVHTTEYNLDQARRTIGRGITVLYQRRHIERLGERLAAEGHQLLPVDFDPGGDALDGFIDLPPFLPAAQGWPLADTPHLRVSFRGHAATSIGLIIRAAR